MKSLVLASSSPYRGQLLAKLGIPFKQASPDIDESPQLDESPDNLVQRLAEQKAEALRQQHPSSLIIGSDQVACFQGRIIGKPGSHDKAREQLQSFSGQCVEFSTGLCLLNSETLDSQISLAQFRVHFRELSDARIEAYLNKEQPYDCAGSFKSEGLGIALFSRLEGDDPNSLVGLPLILLTDMLLKENMDPLSSRA
ncbi:Maf family protein [Pseudoteredinibacter isoporae]|uniref:7-methyl-GTP pyrophosphatase n=1 Tax=Pseudoteredinibacter isoporae TaxID=570281 RepID=A0A7X0JV60_9GAMM|nr:Maf family nucleotide pyrophosphatase [Pseudoteredinibacter isoporae]MBB6521966.1 MAF protein [Pseudoteredinibacter isoporae]NHO87502.1 septum formation inhibitor Maf [Pseudoteredinibacter isoporae]NIB24167.1 septum formation inhibitor Maf [Pseudoteredinibacter isoporae]